MTYEYLISWRKSYDWKEEKEKDCIFVNDKKLSDVLWES